MGSSPTDILMATVLPMVGLPMLAAKGFGGDGEEGGDLPPLPPNATEADKEARRAAIEAKKRQRAAAQSSDGRGSTILTGGLNKLGELNLENMKPKGLLGL